MTRFRAFAIHLTASVLLFLLFLGILWFVGYPAPYFAIDGGWTMLLIGWRAPGAGAAADPALVQIGQAQP